MAAKTSAARASDIRSKTDATIRKEERAKEGAEAMRDYIANAKIVRERMAQLRARRLAKEAADNKAAAGKKRGS